MSLATMRVDTDALYESLDRKRRHLRLRRHEVAALLGVSRSSLYHWSQGDGPSTDVLVRVCTWLDRDPREFARDAAVQG